MKRIICDIKDQKSLASAAYKAAKILQQGGIVAYPTDTAYGLGCDALDIKALRKIFAIKGRSGEKPLSIAIKNIDMLDRYAVRSPAMRDFLEKIWPVRSTLLLQKRSTLPDMLTGGKATIGLRLPNHPFHEALFQLIDFPVTATSANISGEGPMYDPDEIATQFEKEAFRPDLLIDAGKLQTVPPSTIIDFSGKEPKILRIGPVKPEKLLEIFSGIQ